MKRKLLPLFLAAAVLLSGCTITLHDPPQDREVTLYLPNEDGTGFEEVPTALPPRGLLSTAVLDALREAGALPKGVKVVRLEQTGAELALDVSGELAEALTGMGSTEEYMTLGSLVNSLLSAYGAETMRLTSGGAPLETGHDSYDEPLAFFANENAAAGDAA